MKQTGIQENGNEWKINLSDKVNASKFASKGLPFVWGKEGRKIFVMLSHGGSVNPNISAT